MVSENAFSCTQKLMVSIGHLKLHTRKVLMVKVLVNYAKNLDLTSSVMPRYLFTYFKSLRLNNRKEDHLG